MNITVAATATMESRYRFAPATYSPNIKPASPVNVSPGIATFSVGRASFSGRTRSTVVAPCRTRGSPCGAAYVNMLVGGFWHTPPSDTLRHFDSFSWSFSHVHPSGSFAAATMVAQSATLNLSLSGPPVRQAMEVGSGGPLQEQQTEAADATVGARETITSHTMTKDRFMSLLRFGGAVIFGIEALIRLEDIPEVVLRPDCETFLPSIPSADAVNLTAFRYLIPFGLLEPFRICRFAMLQRPRTPAAAVADCGKWDAGLRDDVVESHIRGLRQGEFLCFASVRRPPPRDVRGSDAGADDGVHGRLGVMRRKVPGHDAVGKENVRLCLQPQVEGETRRFRQILSERRPDVRELFPELLVVVAAVPAVGPPTSAGAKGCASSAAPTRVMFNASNDTSAGLTVLRMRVAPITSSNPTTASIM